MAHQNPRFEINPSTRHIICYKGEPASAAETVKFEVTNTTGNPLLAQAFVEVKPHVARFNQASAVVEPDICKKWFHFDEQPHTFHDHALQTIPVWLEIPLNMPGAGPSAPTVPVPEGTYHFSLNIVEVHKIDPFQAEPYTTPGPNVELEVRSASQPPHQFPRRPRINWKPAVAVAFALVIILAGSLTVIGVNNHKSAVSNAATATAQSQLTVAAQTMTTINKAHTDATATALARAAAVQATATAKAQATQGTIMQNPDPYGAGGTLQVLDPMSGPGSSLNWDNGNDTYGDKCTFGNRDYQVFGQCTAEGPHRDASQTYLPARFVFEVTLAAGNNCGELQFNFDNGNSQFYASICQNGNYDLTLYDRASNTNTQDQSGSSSIIHTANTQSNIIAVAADGANMTLYVNHTMLTSIPDNVTTMGALALWGVDPSYSGGTNDYRQVAYTNARLWSL